VSDVVLLDPSAETGAANRRRLGAIQCGKSPGFEDVQGLLDLVMMMLEVREVVISESTVSTVLTASGCVDPSR